MGRLVAVPLLVVGLGVLWSGWRNSQRDPRSVTAAPLGITGGTVSLGGLAVLAGGWDVIGQVVTVVSAVVLVAGLGFTALISRR